MKINILYWGDKKERLANTNLSWHYLKNFSRYCIEHGCLVEPFLFDFSEIQVLDDAIHIPYPNGEYKRAEKINKVFEYHSEKEEFIGICDSDVVIREEDYESMKYFITILKHKNFYVFKLDDLISLKGVDFENKQINFGELELKERNFEPDLGALFFIHNSLMKEVDGFDERFTVWGGEDNHTAYKLLSKGYNKKLLPLKPIHLLHEHALIKEDIKQYQKQVDMLKEYAKK